MKKTTITCQAHIVELGKATTLTLGGSGTRNEYARPNAKFQGF